MKRRLYTPYNEPANEKETPMNALLAIIVITLASFSFIYSIARSM